MNLIVRMEIVFGTPVAYGKEVVGCVLTRGRKPLGTHRVQLDRLRMHYLGSILLEVISNARLCGAFYLLPVNYNNVLSG